MFLAPISESSIFASASIAERKACPVGCPADDSMAMLRLGMKAPDVGPIA